MKDPGLRETYNAEAFSEQWITILSVDLEEGTPIWHFSMAVRDCTGEDEGLRPLEAWRSEAREWFHRKIREAFPPADGSRRVYTYTKPTNDPAPSSLHAVMKMTLHEQKFICDPKWGARSIDDAHDEILETLLAEKTRH